MSASTRTVPAQIGFGRLPSALAMVALVLIIAVAVAIVALNGTKAAAPATSGAKGAPPPIGYDHGSSGVQQFAPDLPAAAFPAIPNDHGWSSSQYYTPAIPDGASQYGGFGGPRVAPVYKGDNSKDDQYLISRMPFTGGAPHGVGRTAQ